MNNSTKGFTLLETVLYIALLSMLITGLVLALYRETKTSDELQTSVLTNEEISFLFHKIKLYMKLGTKIIYPLEMAGATSSSMLLQYEGSTTLFFLEDGQVKTSHNGYSTSTLTDNSMPISSVIFQFASTSDLISSTTQFISELQVDLTTFSGSQFQTFYVPY